MDWKQHTLNWLYKKEMDLFLAVARANHEYRIILQKTGAHSWLWSNDTIDFIVYNVTKDDVNLPDYENM